MTKNRKVLKQLKGFHDSIISNLENEYLYSADLNLGYARHKLQELKFRPFTKLAWNQKLKMVEKEIDMEISTYQHIVDTNMERWKIMRELEYREWCDKVENHIRKGNRGAAFAMIKNKYDSLVDASWEGGAAAQSPSDPYWQGWTNKINQGLEWDQWYFL